ncbi:N-acetyl sugar amidotransferase [Paramagnetospirillum kuznetsovii]|nr:N-acetyl sugar amidotransferase [Paramagnetospirillum kuznetsovii]
MEELEVKYGLPREVKFCKRCVVSNQRPSSAVEYKHTADSKKVAIHFDEDGICDACRVSDTKALIDWDSRERELRELCDRYRRDDGHYDCIVPGSGGKDSVMQSHLLKYKYGMHPLTITWAPHMYTDWGYKNFQSWLNSGFDNHLVTPNPRVHRLLTRLAVEKLFHPFQPFIIGQKALAAKFSVMMNIPLIFYGENEAEYGNPREDIESAKRSWAYSTAEDKSQVYLSGVSVAELGSEYGLHPNDLDAYLPANPGDMERVQTEIHYLGYYLRWHPQGAYYYAHEHTGFQAAPERTQGTYSKYNSIDDKIDDFHYYTTFIKFGIGRATYDAAQEVRSGDITREEGVALIQRFDGEFPDRFADEIFRYLSVTEAEFPKAHSRFEQPVMTKDYFDTLADKFRSPHLWMRDNGEWRLRHTVWRP